MFMAIWNGLRLTPAAADPPIGGRLNSVVRRKTPDGFARRCGGDSSIEAYEQGAPLDPD